MAILSAVETVNPKIESTLDAAALCKMADRGQITGGILDGPLAFDNAISAEAAETKNIARPSPGRPTSWWCPTSKPATCSPSSCATSPGPTARASCSARGCRSC